ncbi:hypothetical protein HY485_04650 [Candidatus Woesearchaeota archaeon]|nr:hypothetical protein [Candidatus Woesearchaeota archaeon]
MTDKNDVKKKYEVLYHIKHGVSPGFAVKYDDETEKREEFEASNTIDAIFKVEQQAWLFVNEYMSNYSDGKTIVQVLLLKENGVEIKILEELACIVPAGKNFEDFKKLHFSDGKHYTVERTWLDHVVDNIPF